MFFFGAVLISALLQISVMQCDADPSGKRDSTAAFAKCLTEHPSGDLLIPVGRYQIKGTINKNRNQSLIGMGSKASILTCESTTQPCIVAADSAGGANNYSVSSIENLGMRGPGPGNASIGIYLGADPAGKINDSRAFGDAVNLINVRVTGFNHGVEWGNNAYVNKVVRSLIFENDVALFVPKGLSNSGEAISVTDSDIFNNRRNGIEDHGNFEWFVQGTSFDYNLTAIEFYGATIHAVNCHFEQEGAQVFFQPFGMASFSLRDSEILIQANSGDEKYVLSTWPQSLNLVIDNVSIWANHTVRYFMHRQGDISGTVVNLHGNGNKKIGAFSDAPEKPALKPSEAF